VLGCGGLRAILKASNLCALEPNQIGHTLVDRGVTKSYNTPRKPGRKCRTGNGASTSLPTRCGSMRCVLPPSLLLCADQVIE